MRDIVKLGNAAKCKCDSDLYAIAAADEKESALLLTYYNDDEKSEDKSVRIEISGARLSECVKAEFYLINEEKDLELVREEYFTSDKFALIANIKNYDTYLIKLKNEKI